MILAYLLSVVICAIIIVFILRNEKTLTLGEIAYAVFIVFCPFLNTMFIFYAAIDSVDWNKTVYRKKEK